MSFFDQALAEWPPYAVIALFLAWKMIDGYFKKKEARAARSRVTNGDELEERDYHRATPGDSYKVLKQVAARVDSLDGRMSRVEAGQDRIWKHIGGNGESKH